MTDIRKIKQKEFTEKIIENNYSHIYIIAPRVGKTRVLIEALRNKEHKNIAITVPRETIIDSWNKEIEKWNSPLKPTLICNNSLSKLDSSVDLLIVDECQTLSPKQIETIKLSGIKRLLFVTGTLNKEKQDLYKREFGLNVIIDYSIDKAIDDGIIADYEINIIKAKLTDEERKAYDILTKTFTTYSEASKADRRFIHARTIAARKRMFFIYGMESKVKAVKKFIKTVNERYILFSANTKVSEELSNNRYDSKVKNKNLDKFISKEINDLGVIRMVDMGKRYALTS